jgi:hypothetical protein
MPLYGWQTPRQMPCLFCLNLIDFNEICPDPINKSPCLILILEQKGELFFGQNRPLLNLVSFTMATGTCSQ